MSNRIDTLCAELSLTAVANDYATLADEAAKKKLSFITYLERVLAAEAALRAERSRQMLVKLATFPTIKTLEQFDFDFQPSLDRRQVRELSGLSFIERAHNVVILGPPSASSTRGPTAKNAGMGQSARQGSASVRSTTRTAAGSARPARSRAPCTLDPRAGPSCLYYLDCVDEVCRTRQCLGG